MGLFTVVITAAMGAITGILAYTPPIVLGILIAHRLIVKGVWK